MIDSLQSAVRLSRKASGLSQAKLAKLAGVGKAAVFDLEHGKKTIQLDTVTKILSVLNIKVSFQTPSAIPGKTNKAGKAASM
jgi:y4mF family transcriptional regulator